MRAIQLLVDDLSTIINRVLRHDTVLNSLPTLYGVQDYLNIVLDTYVPFVK